MLLLLTASLFFAEPAPLEMPKASAYLVREPSGRRYLKDRYNVTDLWTSRAVTGRWIDDDGRIFTLSRLAFKPPAVMAEETKTRLDYAAVPTNPKDLNEVFACVDALSPVEPAREGKRPHQTPRGYRDVRYFQGTNESAIVCAYRPEGADAWQLATWELVAEDDFDAKFAQFEETYFEEVRDRFTDAPARTKAKRTERELLRRDVRHAVAAYPNWHVTDAEEFCIVDDLPTRGFVTKLTNDLAVMRAKYAAAMPSPLDGSNTLCVARLFASRTEYMDALAVNAKEEALSWSAAYWCPGRRELVAYLPKDGDEKLLRTIRHEAFHQYLSYACSMLSASPWLNEGYAEYFEDAESDDWGLPDAVTAADIDRWAESLPALFALDYEQFYAGTQDERHLKYRLAWSVARFLEKGADEVRFRPFANLKRDYIRALLDTEDMRQATVAAFGTQDNLQLFVREWKKYWKGE